MVVVKKAWHPCVLSACLGTVDTAHVLKVLGVATGCELLVAGAIVETRSHQYILDLAGLPTLCVVNWRVMQRISHVFHCLLELQEDLAARTVLGHVRAACVLLRQDVKLVFLLVGGLR